MIKCIFWGFGAGDTFSTKKILNGLYIDGLGVRGGVSAHIRGYIINIILLYQGTIRCKKRALKLSLKCTETPLLKKVW